MEKAKLKVVTCKLCGQFAVSKPQMWSHLTAIHGIQSEETSESFVMSSLEQVHHDGTSEWFIIIIIYFYSLMEETLTLAAWKTSFHFIIPLSITFFSNCHLKCVFVAFQNDFLDPNINYISNYKHIYFSKSKCIFFLKNYPN